MSARFSFRSLWRQESWSSRLVMVAAVLLGVLSIVSLLLDIAIGFSGDWHVSRMADSGTSLVFAVAMYEWVYWRRRAVNAEKSDPYLLPIRGTVGGDPVANIAAGLRNYRTAGKPDA